MKKVSFTIAALLVICAAFITAKVYVSNQEDKLFGLSLEMLADGEGVNGHCKKEVNACMIQCPNPSCAVHFYANFAGPAYNVSGTCPECGTSL